MAARRKDHDAPPGLRAALDALKRPKGPPPETPPRPSTFPGPKPTLLDGQLDLDGGEYRRPARRRRPR